jgi:hypothetical protein
LRRDLHDGLGPSLAGIMVRAELLGQLLTQDEVPKHLGGDEAQRPLDRDGAGWPLDRDEVPGQPNHDETRGRLDRDEAHEQPNLNDRLGRLDRDQASGRDRYEAHKPLSQGGDREPLRRGEARDSLGRGEVRGSLGRDEGRRLLGPGEGAAVLRELRREAFAFLAEMRCVLADRGPVELEGRDLASGLESLGRRMFDASGERVLVSVDVDPRVGALDWAVQVAAFWIVKEALTNVVKHAGACVCVVRVWVDGGLRLSVVDDGLGGLAGGGIGLASMRERAAELGGSCDVVDTGRGVAVTAHLPEGMDSHDCAA